MYKIQDQIIKRVHQNERKTANDGQSNSIAEESSDSPSPWEPPFPLTLLHSRT